VTAGGDEKRRWVAPAPRPAREARAARAAGEARRPGIPALDGVRAIAVALVLVDHGGIPGLSGGFIGVDVFFVLSGFLITSLLLDELGRTGRIDLPGFWIRRAKRLLPALLLMVLAVAFAREAFSPEAVAALRDDAVAAFLWVANWNFVAHKADYFSQGETPSPLQHTWSLGVEEQYYLVWPLLLVAVAVVFAFIARRRRATATVRTVRVAIVAVATVGVLASAATAILLVSPSSLDRVYFGTDTRAQALLVGAAAAALLVGDWSSLNRGWSTIRSRWARRAARVMPVIGLVALAAVVHFATGDAGQFRRGLLIVVALAAVAVIAPVALDQQGPVARVLALRPLVWLGAISYGVYLWHWPVFLVINGERTGASGLPLFIVRCIATVALATASWWLIEQPIRRWRPVHVPMLRLAAATVATAAAVTTLVVPVGGRPGENGGVSTAAVEASVETPRLANAVPRAPGGPRAVSVFGDSIAWTMMRYLPPTPGFEFIDHTVIGCGVVRGGPYRYFGETLDQKPECDTWPDRWLNRVVHDQPDVVLLVIGRWETMDRMFQGRWTHIGDPAFDAFLAGELTQALDVLSSTRARVVVTTEPYNRRGERSDGGVYPEDQPERVNRWNALLRRVVGQRPNVTVLDLNKKLAPNGSYTAKINGVLVRSDGVHPTPDAVNWMTPWLLDALR
jgi:peptidoglycan/LPS O-acetylase OafA/YrhL